MDPPTAENRESESQSLPRRFLNYKPHTPRIRSNLSREYIPGDADSDFDNDTTTNTITMSLPGLGLEVPDDQNANTYTGGSGPQSRHTQNYVLYEHTELRLEVPTDRVLSVKVVEGGSEIFGTELLVGKTYNFTGCVIAVYTWKGCTIDVTPDYGTVRECLISEYIAKETNVQEILNIHWALEKLRLDAAANGTEGPRVLVVGPNASGKTSLAKTLVAYAYRTGRGTMLVNMDPSEGVLTVAGTLTACVFKSLIQVEEGWGNAPISGPNGEIPVKMPIVYFHGSTSPEDKEGAPYKKLIKQVALTVWGRTSSDQEVRTAGVIVDSPGSIVDARAAATGYDILAHSVSELGINSIVCLGSERLYSDLVKKFEGNPSSRTLPPGMIPETISVTKIVKSEGVVERSAYFIRKVRHEQVRTYFYGSSLMGVVLQPRQQQVDFDSITVWRRISSTGAGNAMALTGASTADEDNFLPGDAGDDEYVPQPAAVPLPASQLFERLTSPIPALRNCILCVLNCSPEPEADGMQDTLRDASVMGFIYVTDIDEARGRISLLSPVVGRVPPRALIWAESMEPLYNMT